MTNKQLKILCHILWDCFRPNESFDEEWDRANAPEIRLKMKTIYCVVNAYSSEYIPPYWYNTKEEAEDKARFLNSDPLNRDVSGYRISKYVVIEKQIPDEE